MKRVIAWVLILTLCLGLFAGCKKNKTPTDGDVTSNVAELEAALEYVKTVYKNVSEKTPKDYQRIGNVPVNGKNYEVVWSVNVEETYIKVIKGTDGMVTIDVNEEVTEDVQYVLTATISNDAGNSVSHSWNHLLPAASGDMISIVNDAYALAIGESMDYEVTLTGVITAINTPWSDDYKNITVTIAVAGAEDKPIQCYRLTGEGAKDLRIGDTITVTGTLKNYNGTVEFDAGCTLDAVIKGEEIKAPSDPKKIVDEAYALGANKSLPYEATLTGTITAIGTAYSDQYKNITVTMVVAGRESKPIVCYRLKGTGVDKIGINDEITVKGYITNYVGDKGKSTVEFTAGCQLLSWVDRAEPQAPSDPTKIVDEAYALGANQSLKYEATLTGKITKVNTAYDASYDNVTVTMVVAGRENKPIVCYRMKGTGADKIDIGDTITVKGYITNYVGDKGNSTVEFNYPTLVSYKKNTATAPTDDVAIVKAAYALKAGEQLPYKATLTGKITAVNTAYDAGYGNITITIVVEGAEDMPIKCFRLKGTGVDKIGVGDTVTVSGYIENYQHSSGDTEVEFTSGCTLDSWQDTGTDPEPNPGTDPDGTVLTVKEAVTKGAAMEHNTYTSVKYKVTGEIAEVYDTTYGNMKIKDTEGNILTIYGTWSSDGTTRYDAMATKPVAGDTVTIYGPVGQYGGTAQIKNGWIVAHTPAGTDPTPDPEPEPEPAATATLLTEKPVADDVIVIYNSGNAMTATASGKKLAGVAATVTDNVLPLADEMAKLTVSIEGEYYIFTLDGKYLTSADTGNGLSFSDTLTDCGKWTITAADTGTWYLKNVGANYNGNYNQAMEYYNGFTTYGEKQTDIYKMQLYKVNTAPVIPEPATDATLLTEKPVADDVIVIYNSGNAMTATASGKKLAGVAATVTDNVLPLADEMAKLTVSIEGEYYIFTLDGKYLTSADTGNGLSFSDTLTDCGKWTITAADTGTWYLKNVGANYNGNYNQAMEYYSGFTTYGEKQTDIYKMQLYKVGGTAPVIPEPEPEPPTYSFTYDFGTFAGTSVQYADETHDLGNGVTLNIKNCHINGQLRIYSSATNNGVATISSERAIAAIKLNAGNKADVLNVYASTDGNTWTLIRGISVTAAYADHVVELPEGAEYKYLQLDVEGSQQIRVKTIEFTLSPVVQYTYGSTSDYSNVILNWGERGTDATFLSPNAETFYVKKGVTYDALAALSGAATVAEVPSSALYLALQELMTEAHKKTTSYGETRYLYCLTDCQNADSTAGISAFYSGNTIGPEWDGSTWNREHCWPKSKTTTSSVGNSTRGECGDIMTLRPVVSNNNSSRGNKAYGESAGFYNPNAVSNNAYDLRGDVARIVLYTYVRWGNTDYMWGSDGVMESKEILLDWIEADPVDTWELGRNDSVESVTGTRNVFVDYPELAFVLFGEEIPTNMTTPSGEAAA